MRPVLLLSVGALAVAACGGGTTGPTPNPDTLPAPTVACANVPVTQLAVGQYVVVDPAATSGCLRLPAATGTFAQYLFVVASTSGQRSTSGIQGAYLIRASSPAGATSVAEAAPAAEDLFAPAPTSAAARFDAMLREKERELAADPANRPAVLTAPPVAAAPPVVGDHKDFKVCTNLQCTAFATVASTVKYVGEHVAIYQDDVVPQTDPLQSQDFAELGQAFDTYHYGIDTTAFGRESDLDNNGVVDVLMTDAVNALTPDCTDGRIIGYFYGGDLLTGPNSNRAEVFYTLVPAPATPTCTPGVTRRRALDQLKPTLMHEFQHMISYNQHVLVRGGTSEETWLNEAMSHFAEELGGRLVPNGECTIFGFSSCRSQYTSGDILDAYDYLKSPESNFLIYPNSSNGTLAERGASWLFLRWVLDHYSVDTLRATATTRALVATNRVGVNNIEQVTGASFSIMVPEWLMALYLDDGTDLPSEPTGHLQYFGWGLRTILTDSRNQETFPLGYPLTPIALVAGLKQTTTLRGGTGKHYRFDQASNGSALDIQVLKSTGTALDPLLVTRFGIVRMK